MLWRVGYFSTLFRWEIGDTADLEICAALLETVQLGYSTGFASGFGCAFSHSVWLAFFASCWKKNVPFLLPTTMSGWPSLRGTATTCVPTPEPSSIKCGMNSAVLSGLRTSSN